MRRMSVDQKANLANGSLVVVSVVLTVTVDPRFIWATVFMGASLVFSGMANFCGFAVIFKKFDGRS